VSRLDDERYFIASDRLSGARLLGVEQIQLSIMERFKILSGGVDSMF